MITNSKFNHYVQALSIAKDKRQNSLNLHYLMISQNEQHFFHQFKKANTFSDIRSLSKTVMTILLGYIIEHDSQKTLNLDTYVYPILAKHYQLTNTNNLAYLQQIQIRHLLTHTIGYQDVLLMRQDLLKLETSDYVEYLFNYPIVHAPGTHYLYSNAGFYLLSVVLQLYLKQDLDHYLQETLFKDLDITDYKWEKYGDYLAGATRLWLFPDDLMKFGQLLLDDGLYQGKRIVSKEWITIMKTKTTQTPHVDHPQRLFRRYGYGYGVWVAKDEGIFFGLGTDGQALIIVPKRNMVILTLAHQVDTAPLHTILNQIVEDS